MTDLNKLFIIIAIAIFLGALEDIFIGDYYGWVILN